MTDITNIMSEINSDNTTTNSNTHINVNNKIKVIYPDGYLKVIIGCMFSGKTTYILQELKQWQIIGRRVLVINYIKDRRYTNGDKIVSHDKYSADCLMVGTFTNDLTKKIKEYDVVLIDEGQFFKDLKKNVKIWCDDMKKIVTVAGLSGDYLRNNFGEILDLIPDCDDVITLKALCVKCSNGTKALFTWKICDNAIILDDNKNKNNDVIEIGTDKYIALCRKHYNQERNDAIKQRKKIV